MRDYVSDNLINAEYLLDDLSIKYMVGTITPKEERLLDKLMGWYVDNSDEEICQEFPIRKDSKVLYLNNDFM